jgi:hypothetical protein
MTTDELIQKASQNRLTRVIGTGRSGTKFMAKLLGLGHERFNCNGVSSCRRRHVEEDPRYFKLNVHAVRNPVDCISSLTTITDRSWLEFLGWAKAAHTRAVEETLDMAITHYCARNMFCELVSEVRVRIEDLGDEKVNARSHQQLTVGVIESRPMGTMALQLGIKYGYTL